MKLRPCRGGHCGLRPGTGEALGNLRVRERSRCPAQNAAQAAVADRIASTRSGTSATPRVCNATTAVSVERRAAANWARCGQRSSTAIAVGSEPRNRFHTSGNAHQARLINRRRCRLPSITEPPRRTHALRNANCAGSTRGSGCRSNTSPARANTSASITSLLCLPLIAPRSRAACRAPNNDRSQLSAARVSQRHRQRQPRHRRRLRHRHHTRHLGQPVLSDRNPASVGCTLNRSVPPPGHRCPGCSADMADGQLHPDGSDARTPCPGTR